MKNTINGAYFAAQFVKNDYYDLPEPVKEAHIKDVSVAGE